MLTAVNYHSKICKAENRTTETTPNSQASISVCSNTLLVNDVWLQGDEPTLLQLNAQCYHILLPMVGEIIFNEPQKLVPGQIFTFWAEHQSKINVKKVAEHASVNFLHISITPNQKPLAPAPPLIALLNIDVKNQLISTSNIVGNIAVGVYDSRSKGIVNMQQAYSHLLAYVINGSFEVEGRLLEHRDALYLWQLTSADFESLSEAGIILFIQCSPLK